MSTLAARLERAMTDASWGAARLSKRPASALVSVRARGDAVGRLGQAIGRAAPPPNEHCATALGECLWLRPDEWLFVAPLNDGPKLVEALESAVGDEDGAVIDASGSRTILELTGEATHEVLASCCPLDLHPTAFVGRRCAQSLIAKAPVLIQLVDDAPRWRLFVSPSFLDYVVRWLTDGMEGVRAERR